MATATMGEIRAHITAKAAEDGEFRAKLLADPRSAVSEEMGVPIPEQFKIQVHEDSALAAHLILPMSDLLTEEDLSQVAGGSWQDDAADALFPPD